VIRVYLLTESPEAREFFRLAWEFVSSALRPELLARLDCAVFTAAGECGRLEELRGALPGQAVEIVKRSCERFRGGAYISPRAAGLPRCILATYHPEDPPADNLSLLAHEVGHFIVDALDAFERLCGALADDLPSLGTILALEPPEAVRTRAAEVALALIDEGVPSYIAWNYFVRLRARPEEEFLRAFTAVYHKQVSRVAALLVELDEECRRSGRRELARACADLVREVAGEYRHLRKEIHEVARRAFARWPREVFEKNRERYAALLAE
jgi:hypothetical protein